MSKNPKFEESLKKLENIVDQMESSDIDLDKALSLFEEGIKLVHFCSAKLEDTKKKVEILLKKGDKLVPEKFSTEEGSSKQGDNDLFK